MHELRSGFRQKAADSCGDFPIAATPRARIASIGAVATRALRIRSPIFPAYNFRNTFAAFAASAALSSAMWATNFLLIAAADKPRMLSPLSARA